jgi:magnesium-transporting ATPase (P-type)
MSLLPVLFGLPLVLMPLHIVFLELVIDPACSIAFESEPEHPGIMKRPPRNPKARLFDRHTILFALLQGFWLFLATLAGFTPVRVIPRFLPYTTRSRLPQSPFLVRLYLHFPPIWRVLGKQAVVIARKAG